MTLAIVYIASVLICAGFFTYMAFFVEAEWEYNISDYGEYAFALATAIIPVFNICFATYVFGKVFLAELFNKPIEKIKK